ncbi:MAG: ester cyclase, partial [Burkholderiales bacterium]
IKQVGFFWQLIPDLKWEPVDKIVEGNKTVIRAVATGSPVGDFMGIACDGSKAFRIDTIDIHEIVGGRIAKIWHLEDWATAMRQLKG